MQKYWDNFRQPDFYKKSNCFGESNYFSWQLSYTRFYGYAL